jgi:hypothetical protein
VIRSTATLAMLVPQDQTTANSTITAGIEITEDINALLSSRHFAYLLLKLFFFQIKISFTSMLDAA